MCARNATLSIVTSVSRNTFSRRERRCSVTLEGTKLGPAPAMTAGAVTSCLS